MKMVPRSARIWSSQPQIKRRLRTSLVSPSQWPCLTKSTPTPSSCNRFTTTCGSNIPNGSSQMANPQHVILTKRASRNCSTLDPKRMHRVYRCSSKPNMKTNTKIIVAISIVALIAIIGGICYSKAVKPLPPDNAQFTELKFDNLMGIRYPEILPVWGDALTSKYMAGVYNTTGLNGATPAGGGDSSP